ncbi:MAG: protein phosphatase 2C domain-containing protein [Bacteroidota bacterium]
MKIQISQPAALHEAGKKSLNEDFIFPLENQANVEEKLFIVCDGEGGANAGDVASKLVALNVAKYFASNAVQGKVDQEYLSDALKAAEKALSDYKDAHPESADMATSMAMLHIGADQISLGWVGETGVFYYDKRAGKLLEATDKGADATQRIRGLDQGATVSMRFIPISDLHEGDLFFLATKGVHEQLSPANLKTLFQSGTDEGSGPETMMKEIHAMSKGFTEANYSCYLVQIKEVERPKTVHETFASNGPKVRTNPEPVLASVGTAAAATATTGPFVHEQTAGEGDDDPNSRMLRNLTFGVLVVLVMILVGTVWFLNRGVKSGKEDFERFMAVADKASDSLADYRRAYAFYDSAYRVAPNEDDRRLAEIERKKMLGMINGFAGEEEPLDSLQLTAERYLDNANEFFAQGNYEDALRNYRRSERVMERDKVSNLSLPNDKIAEANLRYADDLYASNPNDCAGVAPFYRQAVSLYDGDPNLEPASPEVLTTAKNRLQDCGGLPNAQIASAEGETVPKEVPDGSGTPSVNDGTDPATNSETNNATKQESAKTAATNARKVGPAPLASARLNETQSAPAARLSRGADIDDATMSELRKALSEGKRLYVKAKTDQSAYTYKLSAESLEKSEAILDGSGAYLLGYMYNSGLGVGKDLAKALKFSQKAALKNWPAGHYLYAHLLLERQNPKDTLTAKASLERAAGQNHLDAIQRLRTLR